MLLSNNNSQFIRIHCFYMCGNIYCVHILAMSHDFLAQFATLDLKIVKCSWKRHTRRGRRVSQLRNELHPFNCLYLHIVKCAAVMTMRESRARRGANSLLMPSWYKRALIRVWNKIFCCCCYSLCIFFFYYANWHWCGVWKVFAFRRRIYIPTFDPLINHT